MPLDYNPCEESLMKSYVDEGFLNNYLFGYDQTTIFLDSKDSSSYLDLPFLNLANDIYIDKLQNYLNRAFIQSDVEVTPINFNECTFEYLNTYNKILDIVDKAESFSEFNKEMYFLSTSIDLTILSESDRKNISTLIYIIEITSIKNACIEKLETRIGHAYPRKSLKCWVSVVGGGVLGWLTGGVSYPILGAVAGAGLGWSSGC